MSVVVARTGRASNLVIVGASLAGLRAAETARKLGFTGTITVVGAESNLPYNRPALSKSFLEPATDGQPGPDIVYLFDSDDLARDLNANLVLGIPATGLNTTTHQLTVGDTVINYDKLIIATGAYALPLPATIPSSNARGIHTLRTIDDARALSAALDNAQHVVVIGAGFVGSEVASAARARGAGATIIERLHTPLVRSVGADAGAVVARLHQAGGTRLLCNAEVTEILTTGSARDDSTGHVLGVRLGDGTVIETDTVIVGVGAHPATQWLLNSGIELHADGGIICGPDLATSHPDVYAAGDVAHVPHPLFGGDLMRIEHWTNAAEQGALAARQALDAPPAKTAPAVPYFWSDLYGSRIQFVGTPRAEATTTVGIDTDQPVVLYQRADRIVGAFVVNRPREVMKLRRRIADRGSFADALTYARELVDPATAISAPALIPTAIEGSSR